MAMPSLYKATLDTALGTAVPVLELFHKLHPMTARRLQSSEAPTAAIRNPEMVLLWVTKMRYHWLLPLDPTDPNLKHGDRCNHLEKTVQPLLRN